LSFHTEFSWEMFVNPGPWLVAEPPQPAVSRTAPTKERALRTVLPALISDLFM
jgi:hypothetical protein